MIGANSAQSQKTIRPIDPKILEHLNSTCDDQPVHFVGLGPHDFQISYSRVRRIQSQSRINFYLEKELFTWEDGPTRIPAWSLVGQTPLSYELTTPYSLKLNFASGDWIEFFTEDSPYEDLVIDFGEENGSTKIEVF